MLFVRLIASLVTVYYVILWFVFSICVELVLLFVVAWFVGLCLVWYCCVYCIVFGVSYLDFDLG